MAPRAAGVTAPPKGRLPGPAACQGRRAWEHELTSSHTQSGCTQHLHGPATGTSSQTLSE